MTGRRVLIILIVLCLAWATPAHAVNRYVRSAASGANNGTDWTNAYTTISACETAMVRATDDICYVGVGSYGQVNLNTAVSGAHVLTIQKATIAAHGTSTGWLDAYAGQATIDNGATTVETVQFNSAFWVWDGAFGGGPGSYTGTYGFLITHGEPDPTVGIYAADVVFKHSEVVGRGDDGDGSDGDHNDGIRLVNADRVLVAYNRIRDVGRCIFMMADAGVDGILEHNYTEKYEATGGQHSEWASIWDGSFRWTIRYNVITHVEGTGWILYDSLGGSVGQRWIRIYGNVVYHATADATWEEQNGLVGSWTGASGELLQDMFVGNNTFIDTDPAGPALQCANRTPSGNVGQNNLFINTADTGGNCQNDQGETVWSTISHNHFSNSTSFGTNATTGTITLIDTAGLDFHMTTATTAGTSTAVAIPGSEVDPYGITRGADGTWDRGAVEFCAGGCAGSSTPSFSVVRLRIR